MPLVSAVLVGGGALLSRQRPIYRAFAVPGCLGLAVITVLGAASIGILFLPADIAAAVAVLLMRTSVTASDGSHEQQSGVTQER